MLSETIASVGHCVAKCKQGVWAVEVEKDLSVKGFRSAAHL